MICSVEQYNQLKPIRGNSGAIPFCAATLVGFFIGDSTMKQIKLTQGEVALVDEEDFEELNQYKWCVNKKCYNGFIAVRNEGKPPHRQTIYMHRAIINCPKGSEVDHINHNPLDNRRCNLRICTKAQNQYNQKPRTGSASVWKGVSRSKKDKKWRASIGYKKRATYLGCFDNEIDAAKAYDKVATELFGEFACPNFPLLEKIK